MRELAESNTNLAREIVARERGESLSGPQSVRSQDGFERKFRLALVLYAVLAVLAWFTMGADKVPVMGRPVEMRWIPELVLGVLVFRTVLARHAERIRSGRSGDESGESSRDGGSAS
jgi:uncharacterized membrane protein YgcG